MLLLDRSQEIIRRSASCQRDANFKVTPVNHSRSAEWREIGAWGVSGEVDLNRIPAPYEAYVDLSWTSLLPIISGDYECQKRPGPLGWGPIGPLLTQRGVEMILESLRAMSLKSGMLG